MLELGYKFVQYRAEGPPNRRLILDCILFNTTGRDLVLVAVAAQAHFASVGCVAEGPLFARTRTNQKGPDLPAAGRLEGRFTIPMSNEVLAAIEARRSGYVDLTERPA